MTLPFLVVGGFRLRGHHHREKQMSHKCESTGQLLSLVVQSHRCVFSNAKQEEEP